MIDTTDRKLYIVLKYFKFDYFAYSLIFFAQFDFHQIFCSSHSVENENHCDFVKLREMLLRTNMQDLIEKTHERHYELYRKVKMEEKGFKDGEDRLVGSFFFLNFFKINIIYFFLN